MSLRLIRPSISAVMPASGPSSTSSAIGSGSSSSSRAPVARRYVDRGDAAVVDRALGGAAQEALHPVLPVAARQPLHAAAGGDKAVEAGIAGQELPDLLLGAAGGGGGQHLLVVRRELLGRDQALAGAERGESGRHGRGAHGAGV